VEDVLSSPMAVRRQHLWESTRARATES
jgi:hypothetical protein